MTLTIELDPALLARLTAEAARESTSVAAYVRRAVESRLAESSAPRAAEPPGTPAPTSAAEGEDGEWRYEDVDGRALPVPVFYGRIPPDPTIDWTSNAAIYAALEAGEDAAYIRRTQGGAGER